MKIKSLLIGMLASVALVGCTNEDPIDVGNEKQEVAATLGETYISLAFDSNTNSSRAVEPSHGNTTNTGDTHESAETSGHTVAGTTEESAISEVLVIISQAGNGKYGLADYNEEKVNGFVKTYKLSELKPGAQGGKALPENLRVEFQTSYKALVVVNPVAELLELVKKHGKDHVSAYEEVCEYKGAGYEGSVGNRKFMMSNKEEVTITTTAANRDPENPASEIVNVERAVSKITFRHSEALTGNDIPTALTGMEDVHAINVKVNQFVAETANFWFHREVAPAEGKEAVTTYYYDIFNKATVGEGEDAQVYWVLLKNNIVMEDGNQLDYNSVEGVFTHNMTDGKQLDTYTGTVMVNGVPVTQPGNLLTEVTFDEALIRSMTFVQSADDPESVDDVYYVHLQNYALTNLVLDKVYAVRHITKDYATANTKAMGVLNSTYPYLADPQSEAKNAGTYTGFTNPYATVVAAIEAQRTSGTTHSYFTALSQTVDDEITDKGTTTSHNDYKVGSHMTYCYENAFLESAATTDNVTSIILEGQIYDKNGDVVPVMYKYNGNFYRTLRQLLNVVGELSYTKGGTTYKLTENTADADADLVNNLDVYYDGKCYYYSAQIKHFEDGKDNAAGVMEYAIMRNNIYSLAVTNVKGIGSATLTLTPNAPVVDVSAYVNLEVNILKWIVRFNDLDL